MIVFREATFIANALMSARIFGRLCYAVVLSSVDFAQQSIQRVIPLSPSLFISFG